MSRASAAEMNLKRLMTISKKYLKSTMMRISIITELPKKAESVISAFAHIPSLFDSSVSPEEAHRIGVEWAKKVFGENRLIIVSTHSNTNHCHNHIAVCSYYLDGIRWHSNRKTLDFVRKRSDEICLEHGLDIIRNPKKKSAIGYKEWDSRKKGCSWKIKGHL